MYFHKPACERKNPHDLLEIGLDSSSSVVVSANWETLLQEQIICLPLGNY